MPHLKTYPSLKVWVAGCSGGEELLSLAILFREEGIEERTMFYGTDINPKALERAEAGVYELDRISSFTENHRLSGGKSSLSDYYTAAYGSAVFEKSLRRRAVFSDHSLASDQVFAEVQLICCRNVLIYFDRALQDRAVGLFKDSLARKGFLGLGSKESLRFSVHSDAFDEFNASRTNLPETGRSMTADGQNGFCKGRAPPKAIAIGVSAGALDVLSIILPLLPKNFPLPIFVVVHLAPSTG